jgi:dipeptidyl aminopeptidase/acylaminoacyl peptidase
MQRRPERFLAALSTLLLSNALLFAAPQKPSLDQVLDSLFAVREFKEVAISPDGQRVAWVESLHAPNGAASLNSAIHVADVAATSKPPRRITAGDGKTAYAEHDIAWSPDSSRLAFLSDKGKQDQLELYVADARGGSARKLTDLTGFLATPAWSPDGKRIAFLFTENAPRAAGPLGPMTPLSGVIEERVYEQRLATVEVASGRVRQVSPADLYVYEYDWSPDGKSFAAIAAHGAGDANWYVAELYTIDAASRDTKSIYRPPLQIAVPRWSPNGKSIAFIGGLMSDEGSTGGDIFLVPATGGEAPYQMVQGEAPYRRVQGEAPHRMVQGEARNLTSNIHASPAWLAWLPSSGRILFTELIDGATGIATVNPQDGEISTLWTGAESISIGGWSFGVSLAQDGKTYAFVRQSFQQPPEVWAGPLGAWKQVTNLNRDAKPSWGEAKSLHWSSDGMQVQGWLLYPRDYDPNQRYPMVVSVHGGPGSMVGPGWPETFFDLALLSHQGYFVLLPNPRGSFGQGEAFTRANVKDFGYGDFRDILAGVEEVVKTLPVDNQRIGIGGWSYGGYMTMWAVTQTNRFRAAVAGAGIPNWQSYYGQNDIGQWMIPFFGASVYDDPAVYARSSPITFIKQAKTPTLGLVGDRDGECPLPQSLEFWRALKTLGVETQLVVYPNEGHLIADPAHRRDILKRAVAWFGQHLQ